MVYIYFVSSALSMELVLGVLFGFELTFYLQMWVNMFRKLLLCCFTIITGLIIIESNAEYRVHNHHYN